MENVSSDNFCHICNASFTSPQQSKEHYTGKQHLKKQRQISVSSILDNEYVIKKTTETGDILFCTLCDVPCTGFENMLVHTEGKSHMRKIKRSISEGQSPTEQSNEDPLFCKICNITCTGSESMEEHYRGSSHKKQEEKLDRSCSDNDAFDGSIYYDARSNFDEDSKPKEGILNDSKYESSDSDEDNKRETDETFVKNLLDSFGSSKYTKTIDHTNNLDLDVDKNMEKNTNLMNITKDPSLSMNSINLGDGDTIKDSDRSSTKASNTERVHNQLDKPNTTEKSLNIIDDKVTSRKDHNTAQKEDGVIPDIKPMTGTKRDKQSSPSSQLLAETIPVVKKVNQSQPKVRLPKRQQHFHCLACNQLMNTEKEYESHLKGKTHMRKLLAPERAHPQTVCIAVDVSDIKMKTKPREYQKELFNKAMKGDSICFLPTGTGKTLIGCMVVSALLDQNPTKQVVFLVERGLLVLQQYTYIKKELGDFPFKRFGLQDLTSVEERKLSIAGLCSGSQGSGGVPLWKHDVIVVTAAYYENLLTKKQLRWKDTCLVVFDEAHHCLKSHPYNRLAHFQHKECPSEDQPKLLGLTASPAGKSTVGLTISMLEELTFNMGGGRIEIVEENNDELDIYSSNSEIDIQTVPLNVNETKFQLELKVYLLHCYLKMSEFTNLLQHSDMGELKLEDMNGADTRKFAEQNLDGKLLDYIQKVIGMSGPKIGSSLEEKEKAHNLIKHSHYMCVVLDILLQFGLVSALQELQELMGLDDQTSFEFARSIELPCDGVTDFVQRMIGKGTIDESSINNGKFSKLVDLLLSPDILSLLDEENAMVLILVKERGSAFKVEELLQSQVALRSCNVSPLVGHGTTSGTEPGMKIAHQKVVLDNIRQHRYKIVVATSVAEEGIDIPECELVITLNPPSNVTALVQMRGRARKSQSKFIVVCNSDKEKEDLEDLLERERNMLEAVKLLTVQ